jgi:carboxyl-terminal processing protease
MLVNEVSFMNLHWLIQRVSASFLLCLIILSVSLPLVALSDDPEFLEGAVAEEVKTEDDRESVYHNMRLLTEALLKIKEYHVDEATYEDIIHGAIDGMLRSRDPHSGFLDKRGYQGMKEDTEAKFSGIGIHIGVRHGLPLVISPIEDTPAYEAGLEAGDFIVEIDGEKMQGRPLRDSVKLLRGKKGEKVMLKIKRADEEEPFDVEIFRDDIKVPTVKGARIIRNGIGYVRIIQFARPTGESLQKAVAQLLEKKMDALVVDLRGNPGGLLTASVDVSSLFLKPKTSIVETKGRRSRYDRSEVSSGAHHYTESAFPMVVLVDGGSASASEIVAGALQDNRRAVVIGDTTFGKGSVQSVVPMLTDPELAMRMTTARYHTPSGRMIHGKGINPDILVKVSRKEWRRIRVKRAQDENPESYTAEEMAEYKDVVDVVLLRAMDLLDGLKVLQK